jgi:uncharacterized caspase-like protein
MKRVKPKTAMLAAAWVLLLLAACAMPEPPTRTALVYGVSTYVETWNGDGPPNYIPSPNLSLTDDDAADMSSMLSAKGWDTSRTRIADTTDPMVNAMASKTQIAADIESLAGTEGLVLFYYSGHGDIINGESAICPYGSIDPNPTYTSYTLVPEKYITVSELNAMFKSAGLKNVVVILDSCFSGGFVDEGATADAVPPIFEPGTYSGDISYTWFVNALGDSIAGYLSYSSDSNYVVISASGARELSWESGTYGHGIFTYLILRAASGDADYDNDGYVTTTELYAYCEVNFSQVWNNANDDYLVEVFIDEYQNADYLPHLSGTAREYALWAAD